MSEADGDERRTKRWYRQTKKIECGEMDGKESECPIVASKRGNGPSRTPWSEGGAALWAQRRNHAEGIEPPSVLPQGNGSCEGQRHNVTSRSQSERQKANFDPLYAVQICEAWIVEKQETKFGPCHVTFALAACACGARAPT
jgi:hypothetical protein